MQNQFAVWIAIMFGFTSCTETPDEQFASDLVGTWMEVRTTYAEGDSEEPVSIHRKTMILEKVNGRLRFRNCLDDTHATATVADEKVTLSGDDYPILELSDDDTLTAVETTGETEVALYRVSTEINAVMGGLELSEPGALNTWTQLCLDSVVADNDTNLLSFKAVNDLLGVTLAVTFEFDDLIQAVTYTYSRMDNNAQAVTGSYELPDNAGGTLEGSLSDPEGPLIVSENATWDFAATLSMLDSRTGSDTNVHGTLQVDPEWLETE